MKRAVKLPPFYAIIDRDSLTAHGASLSVFARELRDAGVTLLQYRDKTSAPQEVLRAAAEIAEVFTGAGATLILNDRPDLAKLAGWSGVHVGHLDLPPAAVRRVLGVGRMIGVSTHNDEQVSAADAGESDYIAVGPVFATSTKLNAEPVVGITGLQRARALTSKPIVAIGGVTRANAPALIDAGADSVAVIGELFSDGEGPGKVARDFLTLLTVTPSDG